MERSDLARLILEAVPQTMRAIRTEMRNLSRAELTVPQFRVLNQLARNPQANRDLAEWMGVSAPTMSKMVDLLVQRGFVSRTTTQGDRREIQLKCTKKGMDTARQIREAVQKALSEKLTQLPDEELKTLAAGLRILKGMAL